MIQKNIKKIRAFKGFSQSAFAELFGLTRASVGAYEEGRAKPKTEIAVQIANYFSIPLEQLLTKELTINDIAKYVVTSHDSSVDKLQHDNAHAAIIYISPEHIIDYLNKFNQEDFINQLPRFSLPFIMQKAERCFELDDTHFRFNPSLFSPGEKLFCKKVRNVKKLDPSNYYLLILNDILYISTLIYDGEHKMVYNPKNTVEKIFESEIQECWQIVYRLTQVPLPTNENQHQKLDKYLKL